jgi:hypothetical protein
MRAVIVEPAIEAALGKVRKFKMVCQDKDQSCGSGLIESGSNPVPGFDHQKLKEKNTAKIFLYLFLIKKLQFKGRPSYRKSLQSSKQNIQT